MFPGRQNQSYSQQSNGGYQRPSGAPPSSYNQSYSQQSNGGYQRPSGAPPSNYNQTQYQRPSAPPPSQTRYQSGPVLTGETSSYNQNGITYQRPSGTPQMPHNGRYQTQNGTKKALLIGINYIGSKNALRGCINDVNNMYNFLLQNGYPAENIVVLTDDQRESVKIPTRSNMLRAMQWLSNGASPGDDLFFHYSGHGGQETDKDGEEEDGMDDCIYPVDFQQTGSIIDDIMHDLMVKPLVQGVRLTCLFDSCHSGSALDLPFVYRAQDGGIKEYNVWKESSGDALNLVKGYATNNIGLMVSSATSVFKRLSSNTSSNKNEIIAKKQSLADVIMFSGCKDSQTSADASEAGKFTGALSWALLSVLKQNPTQTYLTLLQNIRAVLAQKYTQKPQLSSSHKIDPNTRFVF